MSAEMNVDAAAAGWTELPKTGPLLRPYRPLARLEVWPPRGATGRLRPGAQVVTTPEGHITGVDFSVWAPSATRIDLCLYPARNASSHATPNNSANPRVVPMVAVGNGWWAIHVDGAGPGQAYGLRAHGPWEPEQGHRFNPNRLLMDPWAKGLLVPVDAAAQTTQPAFLTRMTPRSDAAASSPPSLPLPPHRSALALQVGHACSDPLRPTALWHSHQPAPADNSLYIPLGVVVDEEAERAAAAALTPRPRIPDHRVVLYEAHVKALTQRHPDVPEAERGTYAGLAHASVIAHLQSLGITTLCLLPVASHITERHLLAQGLSNHWGYNPLNTFTPEARFAACTHKSLPLDGHQAAHIRHEFRAMVDALHRAGLEVVLDVVFNHTCESDLDGPTLSWRGLGHADWYALAEQGVPHNFSGCGNSLNLNQAGVVRWVMDSLRWWVQAYGVDGFRFDLAAALGRDVHLNHRFNPQHPLLTAMAQDPVLSQVRLIAEPWDIGPQGYQTGQFPSGWFEWNDVFRDQTRAYWLGHPATRGQWATRTSGSSDLFAHDQRLPTASINFLTAHDGFTLHDLTAYVSKHNEANGEGNRDGHNHNLSTNLGHEGPSTDATIEHHRQVLRRALLSSLFCAQGTPQLLAGDELGHSQGGNNNAYCQDNETTWLDWSFLHTPQEHAPDHLLPFVRALSALRRELPALRYPQWWTGRVLNEKQGPWPDVVWMDRYGQPLDALDWNHQQHRTLCALVTVGEGDHPPTERVLMVWHADWITRKLQLPQGEWELRLDSATAWAPTASSAAFQGNEPSSTPSMTHLDAPTVRVLIQKLPALTPLSDTAVPDTDVAPNALLQRFRPSRK